MGSIFSTLLEVTRVQKLISKTALWSLFAERGNSRGRLHGQIIMDVCAAMNITHGKALNGAIKAKLTAMYGTSNYK